MNTTPDLSSLLEMLKTQNIDINSLMQNISNNNSSNNPHSDNSRTPSLDDILKNVPSNNPTQNSNSTENNNFQMPDMETMAKIMKLMNSLNSNKENPSTTLLYSLKPFLRDSKKEKVDQYIKFLKMSSILNELNKSGGDFK